MERQAEFTRWLLTLRPGHLNLPILTTLALVRVG
jgi:hypothetical protein